MKQGMHTLLSAWLLVLPILLQNPSSSIASSSSVQITQSLPCNGSSQVEIIRCTRIRFEAADKRINQVYRQVKARMNPQEKEALTDKQLAWIKFRDQQCDLETAKNRGGSGYRGFLNECLERVTRSRTAELENWLRQR